MKKIKVFVFPCGSEVGLEIARSLEYSTHIELWGGSSIDDHGKYVYENYIGDIPFFHEEIFIPYLADIVKKFHFDAIFPAMDAALIKLKNHEKELDCMVIGSSIETIDLCNSKKRTYDKLGDYIRVPKLFDAIDKIDEYPVFLKPDIGYGSRGIKIAKNINEVVRHFEEIENCLICEYLPGEEYTVDCFTDNKGELKFVGPRPRSRTRMGISVSTSSISKDKRNEFEFVAKKINEKIAFDGAWFFQVKRNTENELVLLEIASRLGGSSSLYRLKGVNFALLSVFNAFGNEIAIIENKLHLELDRAFDIKMKIDFDFDTVFVDFDDCLIINNKVNTNLLAHLYHFINLGKELHLITKHEFDIHQSLASFRIDENLFTSIIHLKKEESKSNYIKKSKAIFIDDSFAERREVFNHCRIPVYSPDMLSFI